MKTRHHRKRLPNTPKIPTDPFYKVELMCLICAQPTGQHEETRASLCDPTQEFGTKDPTKWKKRKGLCASCEAARAEGCCLVYTETDGLILEPSFADRLKPELRDQFRGGVNRIPPGDMEALKAAIQQ